MMSENKYSDIVSDGGMDKRNAVEPAAPMPEPVADVAVDKAWDRFQDALAAGQVDDMATLIRRLARALQKAAPEHDLPVKAMDYLKRKRLDASPLRSAAPLPGELPANEWPDLEVVKLIVRDACEYEPADPDRNDTLCISVAGLAEIVERHVTRPSPREIPALRAALIDATANLAAAASAYRRHASRHRSVGRAVADPFFTTRVSDFEAAEEHARAALSAQETKR